LLQALNEDEIETLDLLLDVPEPYTAIVIGLAAAAALAR